MSLHRNRGAKRARQAREAFGCDPIAPLPCLLDVVEERAGLGVVVAPLPEGVAGACTASALWVNGRQAAVRQRFTLAHELGHAWMEHDGHAVVDTFATLSGRETNAHEMEANAFASELLIPRAAVEELAGPTPTLDEVVVLAAHYGTSAIMALYRLRDWAGVSDERTAALTAEIEAGEHFAAFERLGCAPLPDRLGALDALPYLTPSLRDTRLGAVLGGDAAAEPELAAAIERLFGS